MSEAAPENLSLHQRARWLAHLWKALAYQYHRPLLPALKALVPPDGVIFDIGAHAGQFAKLFAKAVPRGCVYSFEPGGYALSLLKPVKRLRRLANVRIVERGLSDAPGSAVLQIPIKPRGGIGFGLSHIGGEETRPTRREEIELTTVDAFTGAEGLQRLDFMKVDVEGWEPRVLAGARDSLERFRPSVLIELDERLLARSDAAPEDLWRIFEALGYEAFRTRENQGYAMEPATCWEGSGDYLFAMPQAAANLRRETASA